MVDLPRLQPTVRPAQEPPTGRRPDPALVERGGALVAAAQGQRAASAATLALQAGEVQARPLTERSNQLFDLAQKQQAAIEATQALRISSEASVELETGLQKLIQDKTLDPMKLSEEALKLYDTTYAKAAKAAGGVSETAMRYVDQQLLTRRASVITTAGQEANKRTVENMAGAITSKRDELYRRFDTTTDQNEADSIRRELDQLTDLAVGAGVASPAEGERVRQRDALELARSIYTRLGEKDPVAAAKAIAKDPSLRVQERDAILAEVYQRVQRQDAIADRDERRADRADKKEQALTRKQVMVAFGEAGTDIGKLLELKQLVSRMAIENPDKVDAETVGFIVGHVDSEMRRQRREAEVDGKNAQKDQENRQIVDLMDDIRFGNVTTPKELQARTRGMDVTDAQRAWTLWDQREQRQTTAALRQTKADVKQVEQEMTSLARGVPRWLREVHGFRNTDPEQSVDAVTRRTVNEFKDEIERLSEAGPIPKEDFMKLAEEYKQTLRSRLPSMTLVGGKPAGAADAKKALIGVAKEADPTQKAVLFQQFLARQYAAKLKRETGQEPTQEDLVRAMHADPVMQTLAKDPEVRRALGGK